MTRPFLLANVNRATLLDFAEPAPTTCGIDQRPRASAAWGWASWADLFNLLITLPTLAVKSARGLVDLRHDHADEPGHGNTHGEVHARRHHAKCDRPVLGPVT